MELLNKTVVITGASDGIGKEIAIRLSEEGCNLALIGRNKENLAIVRDLCAKNGASKVLIYPTDVMLTLELRKIVGEIVNEFKTINILINNAGIWQKVSELEEIEDEIIASVIATNLTAHIYLTKFILPYLRNSKEAAIINISSRSGMIAPEGQSVYAASKWGVRGFTEVLKVDLKNTNIRIAGIYQAGTNTKMFEKAGEDFPVEKYTNPKDLANVVAFMLSQPPKIWLHDVNVVY